MNFKMIIRIVALIAIFSGFANANSNIFVYKIANKWHEITAKTVADGLVKNGYTLAKNQDMNGPYLKQFKESSFYSYNLMSVYNAEFAKKMVKENSINGIFVPFSVAVYQKQNDDYIHIAFLSAHGEKLIVKAEDKIFQELEKLNKKTISKIFPSAKLETLSYKSLATSKAMYTRYTFESDDEDANEEYDDLAMMMQGNIKTGGFVVANYIDYNAELKKMGINDYTFYHSYSLCKLKIIYQLSKKSPEAGAFAPCTMVIYHKKGSNKTQIVSLNINSLISMLALKNKDILKMLEHTQDQMISIIKDSIE